MAQSICSIADCDKPARAKGWCQMHYARWRSHGDPLIVQQRGRPGAGLICAADGCDRPGGKKGLCEAHYRRVRLGQPLNAPLRKWRKGGGTCDVEGCEKPHCALGLCVMHWQRQKNSGDVGGPASMKARSGSGYVNPSGYRMVRLDGRDILEHRAVMEALLGRPLDVGENVHHKNGRRADNRPENLELWVVPQPYGQRAEDLVQWVVDHYPALVREQLQKETQHG